MQVKLSGITSFADAEKAKQAEALAASFARCSRSSLSLLELRDQALTDVESARKSNEKIVFEMGHKSIAEHVCLNFDLSGITRFAAEFIEHHRLASFTERSQRYMNIFEKPVVPHEFQEPDKKKVFLEISEKSTALYGELSENLEKKNPSKGDPSKEDSRYALTLSAPTQLGMTVNARSLEHIIATLRNSGLAETANIADLLESEAKEHIPSLIKHTAGTAAKLAVRPIPSSNMNSSDVKLVSFTENAASKIASGLIFESEGVFQEPEKLSEQRIQEVILKIYKNLNVHDPLPRSFELADFTFSINLSSCAFAQLKRHRMMTLLNSLPDPALGFVVPESVVRAGYENKFRDLSLQSEEAWKKDGMKISSSYLLANSIKRTVLVKMNARELCHFSRLRMDSHSQWEIRKLAGDIIALVFEKAPLSSLLYCGKDSFEKVKTSLTSSQFNRISKRHFK